MSDKNHVVVYTDGACKGNPGVGGWGAVLRYGDHEKLLKGGEGLTTNNRMEMMAVIKALEALKSKCHIKIYTDSQYVKRGVTEWLEGWKKNGWRTASRQEVKNVDLWKVLDDLIVHHHIEWFWVKGHAGHPGNELADQLANLGAESAK